MEFSYLSSGQWVSRNNEWRIAREGRGQFGLYQFGIWIGYWKTRSLAINAAEVMSMGQNEEVA